MIGRPSSLMAYAVLLAALAFGASPFLVPGFNGFEANQFPVPQVDPPVQPAGYAFAIWGLIYVALLVSAVYGIVFRSQAVDWAEMRPPLALSLFVGVAWLPVAQASPVIATVLIWIMLIAALNALGRAPTLDRWLARGPVALYAGWLTAASFVALGLVLAGYGVMSGTTAAVLCLVLALILAAAVMSLLPDIPEYGLAMAWALAGVAVANWQQTDAVAWLAIAGAAVMMVLTARSAAR